MRNIEYYHGCISLGCKVKLANGEHQYSEGEIIFVWNGYVIGIGKDAENMVLMPDYEKIAGKVTIAGF